MLICTISIRSPAGQEAAGEAALARAEGRQKRPGGSGGRGLLVLHLALQLRDQLRNRGVRSEALAQALLDETPHPRAGLASTLGGELARRLKGALVGTHGGPHLCDSLPGLRTHAENRGTPPRAPHAEKSEGMGVLRPRTLGGRAALAVCFVHRQEVREFDHSFFDALELISGPWLEQHDKAVDHGGDRYLRLAN